MRNVSIVYIICFFEGCRPDVFLFSRGVVYMYLSRSVRGVIAWFLLVFCGY